MEDAQCSSKRNVYKNDDNLTRLAKKKNLTFDQNKTPGFMQRSREKRNTLTHSVGREIN